ILKSFPQNICTQATEVTTLIIALELVTFSSAAYVMLQEIAGVQTHIVNNSQPSNGILVVDRYAKNKT
ncbi:MAG: hypothetical protein ACRCZO_02435, partial [Cetobacterium sp.]